MGAGEQTGFIWPGKGWSGRRGPERGGCGSPIRDAAHTAWACDVVDFRSCLIGEDGGKRVLWRGEEKKKGPLITLQVTAARVYIHE